MPLEAMTGFGSARSVSSKGEISVDIKSLNNKYLDVLIKSQTQLSEIDILVKNMIKQEFIRGSFEVRIEINHESALDFMVNHVLLKKLLGTLNESGFNFQQPSLQDIARIPGILVTKANQDKIIYALKPVLKKALIDLSRSRKSEGQKIQKIFDLKLTKIFSIMKKFAAFQKQAPAYRKKMLKTKHALLGLDQSSDQFNQELDMLNIKHDFAEEVERISFHLDSIGKALKTNASEGKKIDFLLQELFREANTLVVKVDNPILKNEAIDLKLIIEGLREQSQNLQ